MNKEIKINRNNKSITFNNDNTMISQFCIADEVLDLIEDLQKRIDKAIEYILINKLYCFKYDDEELFEIITDKEAKDDLLNILKGSDK